MISVKRQRVGVPSEIVNKPVDQGLDGPYELRVVANYAAAARALIDAAQAGGGDEQPTRETGETG